MMRKENSPMLPRFPVYSYTKLGITCDTDNNFATDMQFQLTFQSYGLPPYRQCPLGEISVPDNYRLNYFDVCLTFPAQAQRFPRMVGVYYEDPSQLHAMTKEFGTRMYDDDLSQWHDRIENPLLSRLFTVYPKANHTIAQFPMHLDLSDVRPRKYKFEFENSAKQVELLEARGQFQDQDYDQGHQHRRHSSEQGSL
jgi:hypothetical protein